MPIMIPAIALSVVASFATRMLRDHFVDAANGSDWKPSAAQSRNEALSMLVRVHEHNDQHPGRSLGRHQMRINHEDAITEWTVGVDDSFLHLSVSPGLANVKLSVPLADVTLAAVEAQVSRGVVRPDVELRFEKGLGIHLVISAASAELIMRAGLGAMETEEAVGYNTVGHHERRGW